MEALTQAAFWWSEAVKVAVLAGTAYLSGLLVLRFGVLVNYTRKIVHFAVFLVPILVADVFPYDPSLATATASGLVLVGLMAGLVRPVRERVGPVATMFRAIDRPEDRPYTLVWLSSQVAVGYAVLLPLAVVFASFDRMELIYIPILVNGLGDGLAEPVGVRFGKRHYTVKALGVRRTYTRTLEGSACVFGAGVLAVLLFRDLLPGAEFWAALALLPPVMTWAEARSPHTWDSPFLFLAGGAVLLGVVLTGAGP